MTSHGWSACAADVLDIANQLAGARFAMITFDSVARLDLPWTTDYGALSASTDVIRQERTYNSLGSRLDVGLDMAESTLRRAKQADSGRRQLVFFFSDGEQTNPLEARSFRRLRGAVAGGAVFGYGTAVGGPMMRYTSAGYDFDTYIMTTRPGNRRSRTSTRTTCAGSPASSACATATAPHRAGCKGSSPTSPRRPTPTCSTPGRGRGGCTGSRPSGSSHWRCGRSSPWSPSSTTCAG